jgi:regulatory protein
MKTLMHNALQRAIQLLTRREHGARELAVKLSRKGLPIQAIDAAIIECQRLGLQSDVRYVENRIRSRMRQGYGPQRIRLDLNQANIDRDLVDQALLAEESNWCAVALAAFQKKYKQYDLRSLVERQKQQQFLLYRGFSLDTISAVFLTLHEEQEEPNNENC